MIHVIATVALHEGQRDAFIAEFHKLMPKVHAEAGCLEYGPTVDVNVGLPRQLPHREHVVTIVEKWESIDALKTHLDAPHMLEYRERVQQMVKGVALQVLEPV